MAFLLSPYDTTLDLGNRDDRKKSRYKQGAKSRGKFSGKEDRLQQLHKANQKNVRRRLGDEDDAHPNYLGYRQR